MVFKAITGPRTGPVSMRRKEILIAARGKGLSVIDSCKEAGISRQTYYEYLKDKDYRSLMEEAISGRPKLGLRVKEKLQFQEFRRVVLGRLTFPHMQQWVDWFQTTDNDHILILCPPECAKTTTVLDFILYQIYLDPDIRIGYVSKSLPHSVKQVSKVKNVIEQNQFIKQLCGDLVPGPGDPHPWRDSYFTVRTRGWTAGEDEADYTLAAFGAGSQITGSRFDLLIFDDPDDVNIGPADREKVWNVILQAGETRLGTSGRMIIIGNRQGDEDVYKRILDQHRDDNELWAIYTQSAIVSEDSDSLPVVIWPEKFGLPATKRNKGAIDPNGPWTLEAAYRFFDMKRKRLGHRFHLVYQNDPQGDREKDFTEDLIQLAFDNTRTARIVPPGAIVICALDPAASGGAAVLVYALLPPDKHGKCRRLLVDFEWGNNWRYTGAWDRIKQYGDMYHPRWWVIERSASSNYLLQDPKVLELIRRQGAWLYDLTTGANKHNRDLGVTSLRSLFIGEVPPLILPTATKADEEMHRVLRRQLIDYYPETSQPHDGPMALWFAERCVRDKNLERQVLARSQSQMQHWRSPYGYTWNGGSWSFKVPVVQSTQENSGNQGILSGN